MHWERLSGIGKRLPALLLSAGLAVVAVRGSEPAPLAESAEGGAAAFEQERTDAYAEQLEGYLRKWLVDDYPERAGRAWHRDYSSVEAFLKSVEPNRRRWQAVIRPLALQKTGDLQRRPHPLLGEGGSEWLTLPLGGLTAEGLLALPEGAGPDHSVPLVIAQHGIGSCPERTFGVLDEGDHYHRYAQALLDAGFAVLAPMNLRSVERRNRIERLCRLADTSLSGIELARMQRLLDEVVKDPRLDGDRIGMWGVSLGGMATMFWMPLEPRIKAGVVAAWFNDRPNKMAVPDARYSCFLETDEDHAFFQGWLTEFGDSDVTSLICPRPLLVQAGKLDRIAHWPQVAAEFERSRMHYERLGMADRIQIDLHEAGHEPRIESGVVFLSRWLKRESRESPTGAGVPRP
ncbi:MAG: dienelactone hydrolase family protein [Thermoguttaceae bacterium]